MAVVIQYKISIVTYKVLSELLQVPFRLLGIKLTCHVWAMALCGPSPSLASIVRSAGLFWGPYYAGMETLAATQPYNMTASARQALDKSVLGYVVSSKFSPKGLVKRSVISYL